MQRQEIFLILILFCIGGCGIKGDPLPPAEQETPNPALGELGSVLLGWGTVAAPTSNVTLELSAVVIAD